MAVSVETRADREIGVVIVVGLLIGAFSLSLHVSGWRDALLATYIAWQAGAFTQELKSNWPRTRTQPGARAS